MDNLKSEYEALQQKLALLRRGGGGAAGAANPTSNPGSGAATPSGKAAPGGGGSGGEPRPLQPTQQAGAAPYMTPLKAAAAVSQANKPSDTPLGAHHLARAASVENRAPATGGGGAPAGAVAAPAPATGGQARVREATPTDSLALGCSASDAAAALQSIRFSDRAGGASALCGAAAAAFEEPEFVKLCEQAMSAQLQRTKEGATAHSRILELAGGWGGFVWVCWGGGVRYTKQPGFAAAHHRYCAGWPTSTAPSTAPPLTPRPQAWSSCCAAACATRSPRRRRWWTRACGWSGRW
jgi:hypothetical protein